MLNIFYNTTHIANEAYVAYVGLLLRYAKISWRLVLG